MTHFYLYEYSTQLHLGKEAHLTREQILALEAHLQVVWDQRPAAEKLVKAGKRPSEQRFLKFHRNGTVSAYNYVGVIRCGGATLHLLPKVFGSGASTAAPVSEPALQTIQAHLYWWLSYSERLHFPRNFASLESLPTDLFELLILLFAQHTHELLSRSIYQHYQEVDEEISTLRGRVNFAAYATNYATGRGHKMPCTYDSFQFDNRLNRIIKQVTASLLLCCTHATSRQLLAEIYALLDAVSPQPATVQDCDSIYLSPLFRDFQVTLDYCRLFLQGASPTASATSSSEVFALLLPSQLIFEDFLAGFITRHFSAQYEVVPQAQDLHLARLLPCGPKEPALRFQLRQDLLLLPLKSLPTAEGDLFTTAGPAGEALVLDAKYKLLPVLANGSLDPEGIAQADLYQMVSYALRRGTQRVFLLYPDSLAQPVVDFNQSQVAFAIDDALSKGTIFLTAGRLPVINARLTEVGYASGIAHQEARLKAYLTQTFAAPSDQLL